MSDAAAPSSGTASSAHVLVVDDDDRLRMLLRRYLAEQGFRVSTARDAADARATLGAVQPDAVVLDVTMPGEDGIALTRALRAGQSTFPILLLTARGGPEDQIEGFEAGADDYLGKPFDPRVLLLRLRALLRRIAPPLPAENDRPVRLGALEFDPVRSALTTTEGGVVHLTGGEASLLTVLARRPNEVLSRDELARVLEMDETSERAIDVQVTRLRRKVEPDTREPRFLQTVRGRGYILKPG